MDLSSPHRSFLGLSARFPRRRNIRGLIMIFKPGSLRNACRLILPLFMASCLICAAIYSVQSVQAGQGATPLAHTIRLGTARPGTLYAITLGLNDPAQLQGTDAVRVT